MVERQADPAIRQSSTGMKRRGILAAAGAVVAGIVAKQTAVPVAAANVVLGGFNTANAPNATTTFYLPGPATTAAVLGTADTGIGLQGTAFNSTAVYANIPSAASASNTYAVQGLNQSTGSNGYGVFGSSDKGIGVYGTTGTGLYGIVGASGSSVGSAGLLGVANGPNAVGFGTIAQGGATFAGYFNGTTVVNGTFAVTGGKAAAVRDAAGEYRLMYCVEAPDAWFEDVGKGTLVGGKATITLDPQFAQHVRTDDYHVFLTPYGGAGALRVSTQRADGFTLEEIGGASGGGFSWRVLAKRADMVGERLAKFEMPPGLKIPETPPAPPVTVPPQPAPPPRPATAVAPAPAGAGTAGTSAASPAVQPAPSPRP